MEPTYEVQKLSNAVGKPYLRTHHYTGSITGAVMIWGLVDDGELRGAIAFSCPVAETVRASIFGEEYKSHVAELHRLYTEDGLADGAETHFISRALKRLKRHKPKYWAVVAFADTTEGHDGTVYQAANAHYYGTTDQGRTVYEDQDGNLRHHRQSSDYISISEAEDRGWTPVRRGHKHRYVFFLPDGVRHKRMLHNEAEVEFQDYPD